LVTTAIFSVNHVKDGTKSACGKDGLAIHAHSRTYDIVITSPTPYRYAVKPSCCASHEKKPSCC